MAEKVRNHTRTALVVLLISVLVVIVILGIDLSQRRRVYKVASEIDNSDDTYDDLTYWEEEEEVWGIMEELCGYLAIGFIVFTVLLLISMIGLYSNRNTMGEKHSRKMTIG